MKFSEAFAKVAEEYVQSAEHEGGDALVTDSETMRNLFADLGIWMQYTVDADVHDELASRGDDDTPGGGRLHVLTEEEYCTVFDFINEWGPSYLRGFGVESSFETLSEQDDFDAMMEALERLLKRMVNDRGNAD